MPAGNADSVAAPAVDIDSGANLRVDCYVRATVPPAVTRTVNDVVERLRHLRERGHVADCRVVHWPPERHSVAETTDIGEPTRDELVTEFERWATHHGHSLEPAFRRREIPPSPLATGSDGPRERVRVPLVALAIYEDGTGDSPDSKTEKETLRGVVPYTERPQTDDSRTYTVHEWLSIVEPSSNDTLTRPSQREQAAAVEGNR